MTKKYDELVNSAQEIVLKALTEGRELTEDERNRSQNMITEAKKVREQESVTNAIEGMEYAAANYRGNTEKKSADLGTMLLESDQFKAWSKNASPGSGYVSQSARIPDSPQFKLETKAIITGASNTSGGAFIQNDNSGIYTPMGYQNVKIRDLVDVRTTDSDAVDYVTQTTKITEAAPVAEATSAAMPTVVTVDDSPSGYVSTVTLNPGGGYKPEGSLAFLKNSVNVETIAVWLPITRRALADSGQLRAIINQELKAALGEALDAQIMLGSGTPPAFTGVANTANVLTQAFATDLLTTARKALTQLSQNNEPATAFVLDPLDWETAQLALFAAAPYLPQTNKLWGVPVVEYSGMTTKTGYVANWKKATLWDRQQVVISISDSHADFFTRNLLAVLAELRAAFAITKPKAFVEIATQAAG